MSQTAPAANNGPAVAVHSAEMTRASSQAAVASENARTIIGAAAVISVIGTAVLGPLGAIAGALLGIVSGSALVRREKRLEETTPPSLTK